MSHLFLVSWGKPGFSFLLQLTILNEFVIYPNRGLINLK